ncbi:unnamed protein product [Musa textilis]
MIYISKHSRFSLPMLFNKFLNDIASNSFMNWKRYQHVLASTHFYLNLGANRMLVVTPISCLASSYVFTIVDSNSLKYFQLTVEFICNKRRGRVQKLCDRPMDQRPQPEEVIGVCLSVRNLT